MNYFDDGPAPFELHYANVRRNGRITADVKLVDRDTGETVVELDALGIEEKFHRDRFADRVGQRFGYNVHREVTDALLAKVDDLKHGGVDDILPAGDLMERHPALRPAIIEGVARLGDVFTFVGATKTRKSWAAMALLLCTASGRAWLGRFGMLQGGALLVDNELDPSDLGYRIRQVAAGLGLMHDGYATRLEVWPLRGQLMDYNRLCDKLERLEPGRFTVILIDALYRTYPEGFDENSNADMARLCNRLAGVARKLGAAVGVIHHSSKGVQGQKSVVDVGAGAGALARATDAHIVLREHAEPDCVVLEVANRSFAPVAPLGLCWDGGRKIWQADDEIDVTQLKTDRTPRPTKPKEEKPPKEEWDVDRFAAEFITSVPQTDAVIFSRAHGRKVSGRMAKQFLTAACDLGRVHRWEYGSTQPVKYANRPPELGEIPTTAEVSKSRTKRGGKR